MNQLSFLQLLQYINRVSKSEATISGYVCEKSRVGQLRPFHRKLFSNKIITQEGMFLQNMWQVSTAGSQG